jgi:hypothetical protein
MTILTMTEEQYQAHQNRVKPSREEVSVLVGGKKSKYGNKRVIVDGLKFDSKREAARYLELKAMQEAGEISRLRLQPHLPCDVNGHHVCTYVADFSYVKRDEKRETFEDSKGHRTALYILKKKLVFACHGIEIQEV